MRRSLCNFGHLHSDWLLNLYPVGVLEWFCESKYDFYLYRPTCFLWRYFTYGLKTLVKTAQRLSFGWQHEQKTHRIHVVCSFTEGNIGSHHSTSPTRAFLMPIVYSLMFSSAMLLFFSCIQDLTWSFLEQILSIPCFVIIRYNVQ